MNWTKHVLRGTIPELEGLTVLDGIGSRLCGCVERGRFLETHNRISKGFLIAELFEDFTTPLFQHGRL